MIHSICQIISQTKLISQLACTIWRCVYRLRSYEGRVQRTPHADWLQTVTSSDDVTECRRSRACCDWNGRVCSLHFCALFSFVSTCDRNRRCGCGYYIVSCRWHVSVCPSVSSLSVSIVYCLSLVTAADPFRGEKFQLHNVQKRKTFKNVQHL